MTDALTSMANLAGVEGGEIATTAIAVVAYLDHDQDLAYRVVAAGDTTASTVVGLLHLAAHSLAHDARSARGGDE